MNENVKSVAESSGGDLYDGGVVKRILTPLNLGVGMARHLAWYVRYQVSGDAR